MIGGYIPTCPIARRDSDGEHSDPALAERMDFPPVHFWSTRCVACAIDELVSSGELARWMAVLLEVPMEGTDEALFLNEWYSALVDGAFDEPVDSSAITERRERTEGR